MVSIRLIQGDITKLSVDAIVNAANTSLLGGGGVDGAIHGAAGSHLLDECKTLNGCPTGQAKITKGYNLPAKHVIHTVGPVWHGGNRNEEQLLASCYLNSLKLAEENHLQSIAFPNISTGVYGFPKEQAAEIAINTVKEFVQNVSSLKEVYFVAFDSENYSLYHKKLNS
jgi:O-acetyl-ADP-ribose deacetylase